MYQSLRQHAGFAVATLGAAIFLVSSPAAMAASEDWNSESDPLVAWEDGVRQALAYGTAYTKEGSMKNHTFYKDPRPSGAAVYTETSYNVYLTESTGQSHWRGRCCADESSRSDSGFWRDQYDAWYFASHPNADRGRIYYKVCEDQSWSPDACSDNPWFTFTL